MNLTINYYIRIYSSIFFIFSYKGIFSFEFGKIFESKDTSNWISFEILCIISNIDNYNFIIYKLIIYIYLNY